MTNGIIQQENQVRLKHSGLGIASFIIALLQGFMNLVVVLIAGVLAAAGPQRGNEVGFMIVGLLVLTGIFTHCVGAGLGIAGLVQKNRKKVFAILGLILNAVALLMVLSLMLLCLAVAA